LKKDTASTAAKVGQRDGFVKAAEKHRADVGAIRERNRRRRLRYLLYLNVLILGYLAKRALQGRPLHLDWPSLGPDAWIYLPPILLIVAIVLMMMMPLISGRSPHIRFSPEQIGVNFSDVRGIDVVLEEVTRTLQIFLTYRSFREDLGGNPRRGILFEGRPGTGKTHLAKAMAAEAGVPFFFVSAPAFTSMFQGMTAFKIRAFFRALKKSARKEGGAIGFIEEIDAVGGSRSAIHSSSPSSRSPMTVLRAVGPGDSGGMVNELLIQMQSFDSPLGVQRIRNWAIDFVNLFLPSHRPWKKRASPYNNILVIGATNRAEALDPALLRPGRFDRRLYFDLPSKQGRRELVDYFLARRSHSDEMHREDLREELAAITLGYSPAMIEHILDESLVWAIRDGRSELNWRDVQRARLSEEIGLAHPVAYTEKEKEIIATHEAGHAVAAYLCATDRKLEVLSIIKRKQALGLLAHSDVEERWTKTKSELEATLKIALAGMSSEQLFFGESGTGPSSDLTAATTLAAQMVGSFGMGSSLVSYEAVDNGHHSAPNIVAKVLTNDDTKKEVEDLLKRHKDQVAYLLEANKDLVEALRDALLEYDELLGDEILAVIEKALAHRRR
jgi:cell division protease FtsH